MIARTRRVILIATLGIMASLGACAAPNRVVTLDRTGVAIDTYLYVNHQNEGHVDCWPANQSDQVALNVRDGKPIILMQQSSHVAVLRPRGQQLEYAVREDAQTPDPSISGWMRRPMPADGIIRLIEIFPPSATQALAARHAEQQKQAEAYLDIFNQLNKRKQISSTTRSATRPSPTP